MLKLPRLVVVVGWLLCAGAGGGSAYAMGMESFGPASEHVGRSSGVKGLADLLQHPSRVYWRDINGSENAFYDGDIAVVNELISLYSQTDLAQHPVLIELGEPAAKSFNGERTTPYSVELVAPGSFARIGLKKQIVDGIDLTMPRLIVHIDNRLSEHLGELRVPPNVTLHQAESLKQDVPNRALQRHVAKFVDAHAQRASIPSPDEVLAALRKSDERYEEGFTAIGTRVEMALSGHDKLVGWTVTMGRDRLVVEQRDVVDEDHPKVAGRCEYTIYAGPGRMGSIQASRVWVDGKLVESRPHATFEPVGPNYDLLIGRCLWPLGRGLTCRIDHVNRVERDNEGMLRVAAECYGGLMERWELVVDPQSDYLVREAKAFRAGEAEPVYMMETAGVLSGGGRSVAHTARWIEGGGRPVSIAVTSVSAKADEELVQRTENRLDELQAVGR
jgi:hypothetical protein